MEIKYDKWRSPSLGRDMEVTIFGSSGTPLLGLPTRGQQSGQWHRYGMVEAISYQLEQGFNQLFCIESIDNESFLNGKIDPRKRILRNQQYEAYVIEEVIPFVHKTNINKYIIIAGVDLGGYHAVNLALKYPEKFGKAIGMSGMYDIKPFMNGYFDEDVYFANPVSYMPNLNRQPMLDQIRNVDFRIASYSNDFQRGEAERMSNILRMKFIEHRLDIWDSDGEWDTWQQMLTTHII